MVMKTNPFEMGYILIEKLTKEELHCLVRCYDNGEFDNKTIDILLEKDILNYPEEYSSGKRM